LLGQSPPPVFLILAFRYRVCNVTSRVDRRDGALPREVLRKWRRSKPILFVDCTGFTRHADRHGWHPLRQLSNNLFNDAAGRFASPLGESIPSETFTAYNTVGPGRSLTQADTETVCLQHELCSPEEAETELRAKPGSAGVGYSARNLKNEDRAGTKHWNRTLAVGLSQGFI